jgi:hypothetical protein
MDRKAKRERERERERESRGMQGSFFFIRENLFFIREKQLFRREFLKLLNHYFFVHGS